jgi:hypothetical protein
MTDHKTLAGVEIKNADRGEVSAVFATFNQVDLDGDVTVPGAFPEGAEVPISAYGHASHGGALPVGMGKIRTTDVEAILDGKFWLDTQAGREHFDVVKKLGGKGQWSYGYDPLESEQGQFDGQDVRFLKRLAVHEVSPVLIGAGIGTRTLSAKAGKGRVPDEYKAAIRPHKSTLTNRPWDASAVVAALPAGASVTDLRRVFAWVDSSADPEAKSSYRFPHHHGAGGPANFRAVIAGIAALNGARGGTSIPESDRKGVYNHLARHLTDADREPPELRSLDGETKLLLHEEGLEVVLAASAYLQRAGQVHALRAEKRKQLSQINAEALEWVGEELHTLMVEHKAFMHRLHNSPDEAAAEEFVRYLALRRGATTDVH